jgi:OOP family OmpA-OmpF porin
VDKTYQSLQNERGGNGMKKQFLKALLIVAAGAALVSCGYLKSLKSPTISKPQYQITMSKAQYQIPKLNVSQSMQKVDNFLVIIDASGSMRETYKGQKKFDIAKDVVRRMNWTIPDLKLTGGLRMFGRQILPFSEKSNLIYGMTEYAETDYDKSINAVPLFGGDSPLAKAMDAAAEDLQATQGPISVIIVSDAKEMDTAPVASAENLKRMFGNKLCIYPVLVGNDATGQNLMEQIANAGGCGFSETADNLASSQAMATFVESAFFSKRMKPQDADGDGVTDDIDQCPNTPMGVSVNSRGCALDSDADGVPDYLDRCPDTPRQAEVDKWGCPLDADRDGVSDYLDQCPGTPEGTNVNAVGCWVLGSVLFDFGKWDIKPQAYPELDEIVRVLNRNPGLGVEVQGHTDNVGSASFNMNLSMKRAKAVMDYLLKMEIDQERLSSKGYGFSRPAASNDTAAGRAMNRRVEFKPIR